MILFNNNIFKKMNIHIDDETRDVLKKVRSAMVQKTYSIRNIALVQKKLINRDSFRALSIFHFLPLKMQKIKFSITKTDKSDFSFIGEKWEK